MSEVESDLNMDTNYNLETSEPTLNGDVIEIEHQLIQLLGI